MLNAPSIVPLALGRHPDLALLVAPLLGAPYAQWDCYNLTRHLLLTGLGIDLERDPQQAQALLAEVWWHDEGVAVETVIQPWDLVILAPDGLISQSVGLAIDTTTFVHTTPHTGVCLERLKRWRRRLLQVARLRSLFV